MDFAKRAYDHSYHIDPIVRSLLDTDFYKLLMLQLIYKKHFQRAGHLLDHQPHEERAALADDVNLYELRGATRSRARASLQASRKSLWEIYALTIINEMLSRTRMKHMGRAALDIMYARAKVKLYDKLEQLAGSTVSTSPTSAPAAATLPVAGALHPDRVRSLGQGLHRHQQRLSGDEARA
jgi:nicotinate phosphoribosyltransferase